MSGSNFCGTEGFDCSVSEVMSLMYSARRAFAPSLSGGMGFLLRPS